MKNLGNYQLIHRKYWLNCLDSQKLFISWQRPFPLKFCISFQVNSCLLFQVFKPASLMDTLKTCNAFFTPMLTWESGDGVHCKRKGIYKTYSLNYSAGLKIVKNENVGYCKGNLMWITSSLCLCDKQLWHSPESCVTLGAGLHVSLMTYHNISNWQTWSTWDATVYHKYQQKSLLPSKILLPCFGFSYKSHYFHLTFDFLTTKPTNKWVAKHFHRFFIRLNTEPLDRFRRMNRIWLFKNYI